MTDDARPAQRLAAALSASSGARKAGNKDVVNAPRMALRKDAEEHMNVAADSLT